MHVWIVQTGEPLHCDEGISRGMRAMNTADALVEAGHEVTIWSSNFYHQEKRHRFSGYSTIDISSSLTIKLIPSCGYTKNVSLRRFKDHRELAKKFLNKIKTEPLPDVAMVGFPPIEIANTAVNYLTSHNIPVLLDVKDQWPDIFLDAIPSIGKPFAKLMLRKLHRQSIETMNKATALSAMSAGFLKWSANRAGRGVRNSDLVCPLTTPTPHISDNDLERAKIWWKTIGIEPTDKLRLLFVGSLSRQFDFKTALNGVQLAKKLGVRVELVVCGTGEQEERLKREFSDETCIVFAGWIDYPKYKALAEMSDIALAPYIVKDSFQLSITNKVVDALSFSLPILTPLSGAVGDLIERNQAGWVYKQCQPESLKDVLMCINDNKNILTKMSKGAHASHQSGFKHNSVYKNLVRWLEKMAQAKHSL
jgi:glycosyltransferase involved in cell wall biosynthesis